MLTEPLPKTLDVRKAATRGVTVSGTLNPHDLPRFRGLLAEDSGVIDAELVFSRDEEGRYVVRVGVTASVLVNCERCLEALSTSLTAENALAIVWTDDQAAHLPRHLDPLIIAEEGCDIWELVEEELMLALPAFNYHDDEGCNELLTGLSEASPEGEEDTGKPNPFNVLAQLKPGNEH